RSSTTTTIRSASLLVHSSPLLSFASFIAPATTDIYTLSYTTLFRSRGRVSRAQRFFPCPSTQSYGVLRIHAEPAHRFIFQRQHRDRKSTRLNSSHQIISYAVFCLKKKKHDTHTHPEAELHATSIDLR